MISDPNFREVVAEAQLPGRVDLSKNWRVELKAEQRGTHGRVRRDPLGGIAVSWVGLPKRLRLFQNLNVAGARTDVELDLDLELRFETEAQHPGVVQWIAILKNSPAGEQMDTMFQLSGRNVEGGCVIAAHGAAIRLSEGSTLCIQLNNESKTLILRSVRGRVSPHNPSWVPPSAPQTNEQSDGVSEERVIDAKAPADPHSEVDVQGQPTLESRAKTAGLFSRLISRFAGEPEAQTPIKSATPDKKPSSEINGQKKKYPRRDDQGHSKSKTPPVVAGPVPTMVASRPKAVVIAWDMNHNPVGRAYLLADMLSRDFDVTLVGPLFKRYGSAVWQPVRDSKIEHRTFAAESLGDFVRSARDFVTEIEADMIIACKARMPSMLLGLLLKYRLGCPLLIDVDDHELSFFNDAPPMSMRDARLALEAEPDSAAEPFGEIWTRLMETLVCTFDGRIVSNPALQARFGGTIVRHARDEATFGPNWASRARVRSEFGYKPEDRLILFLGTPRAHKGVFRIADALRRVHRDNLALCVIGDPKDKAIAAQLQAYDDVRVDVFPDQPWSRLPELIRLADGVCLLQDEKSPIAQYQIPAKLTDALATGVPVAATNVPPFADVPSELLTVIESESDLDLFLERVADDNIRSDYDQRAKDYFIGELSYATNRARLTALSQHVEKQPAHWQKEWTELFQLVSDLSGEKLPSAIPNWSAGRRFFPPITRERPFDIAFFWKQNDTGLYGRRHDMMLKYLSQHPRVGRIIQFDAPMDISRFSALARHDADAHLDQANLVVQQTIRRFLKTADSAQVLRRVFLHRGSRGEESFLGKPLLQHRDYAEWVNSEIADAGFDGPLVGWVTPTVLDYPAIHDAMNFSLSVADLIDDHRVFPQSTAHRQAMVESYAETLQRVDLVLANCDATKNAFQEFRRDVHVLYNAAEPAFPTISDEPPEQFAEFDGPIIGYVGNLRDRVDVELLEMLADHDPSWHVVLIGSAHRDPEVLRLRNHPNVHFLGVVPYSDLADYVGHFDVAIMPHLDNEVSKAMNPLKLYVYAAAGVPIVTTNVANITEVSRFARVAKSREEFVAAVKEQLAEQRLPPALDSELTWPNRVETAIGLIERTAGLRNEARGVACETETATRRQESLAQVVRL